MLTPHDVHVIAIFMNDPRNIEQFRPFRAPKVRNVCTRCSRQVPVITVRNVGTRCAIPLCMDDRMSPRSQQLALRAAGQGPNREGLLVGQSGSTSPTNKGGSPRALDASSRISQSPLKRLAGAAPARVEVIGRVRLPGLRPMVLPTASGVCPLRDGSQRARLCRVLRGSKVRGAPSTFSTERA